MRAAVLRSFGGPEALRVASDVPVPSCGPREVLVRVAAASVNPLDCRVRAGYGRALYEPMLPLVLGRDVSGEVVARGDAARAFPLGAAVFGALSPVAPRGTHAEYVAVPEAHLARVPPGWSHIDAAAVPFAALTAWRALFTTANLRPGERLLILGAGGAVGAAATHLASARACPVAVTCAESDASRLVEAGAFDAWDYRSDVSLTAHAKTRDWAPFDVALDCVGGVKSERAATRLLRKGVGRVVTLHGALAGEIGEKGIILGGAAAAFELARKKTLMRASEDVGYHWSVMRPDADGMAAVARLAGEGRMRTPVGATFPLERAGEAYAAAEGGKAGGKVVLVPWTPEVEGEGGARG